jgi:hypothetical protein
MAEDDLGSFFSEIEQIEKTTEQIDQNTSAIETCVVAPVQIVAKPQVIVRAAEIVKVPEPVMQSYISQTDQTVSPDNDLFYIHLF